MRKRSLWLALCGFGFLLISVQPGQAEAVGWTLKVSVDGAQVHLKPNPSSPVAATLLKGTILKSSTKKGDWFRVVIQPGREGVVVIGYLFSKDVEILQKIQEEPDSWEEVSGEYRGAGLSVRLGGGFLYFPGGEFEKGTAGMFERTAEVIASSGGKTEARKKVSFHTGYDLTGDIIYELTRGIGLGLRVEYIYASPESTLRFTAPDGVNSSTMSSRPDLSIISLRPGFYYSRPLNRLVTFVVNGGPVIYFTDYHYTRRFITLEKKEDDVHQHVKARSLGFQGGAGLELQLNRRSAIYLDVQGRYAKITNLKGEESTFKWSNYQSNSTTVKGYLYYDEGGEFPSLVVFEDASAAVKNVRRAVLDLSGVSVAVGFKIKF